MCGEGAAFTCSNSALSFRWRKNETNAAVMPWPRLPACKMGGRNAGASSAIRAPCLLTGLANDRCDALCRLSRFQGEGAATGRCNTRPQRAASRAKEGQIRGTLKGMGGAVAPLRFAYGEFMTPPRVASVHPLPLS